MQDVSECAGLSPLTGLVYDERCLLHRCENQNHPENPERMAAAWARLESSGVAKRCMRIPARLATRAELYAVGGTDLNRHLDKLERMTERLEKSAQANEYIDGDTYVNRYSLQAAQISIGGLTDLCDHVMSSRLDQGFAVIRPPGHHADNRSASGFCLFNSVACAIHCIRAKHPQTKIAVIDIDLHHGNGTESIFYKDPNVLVCSIHRYDHGNFYPGTGDQTRCGEGVGKGFNVNVPINVLDMGDREYLHVFDTIFLPILEEFAPDMVLVSAGFDCAHNDSNGGGMRVSTAGFAHMTARLRDCVALRKHGRLVMALEGGYNSCAVAEGVNACVQVLLGDTPPPLPQDPNWFLDPEFSSTPRKEREAELDRDRKQFYLELHHVALVQQRHWACMRALVAPTLSA